MAILIWDVRISACVLGRGEVLRQPHELLPRDRVDLEVVDGARAEGGLEVLGGQDHVLPPHRARVEHLQ